VHMLCWLLHVPRSYVQALLQCHTATLASKCIHSHEIRVTAERVQKQQHQVKDETVLLLLEDETMDSSCNSNRNIDLPTSVDTLPGF